MPRMSLDSRTDHNGQVKVRTKRMVFRMRKIALVLSLMALFTLAACDLGGGGGAPNTLTMGGSNFVGATSFTITAGQSITFDDPSSSGGIHHLVTGSNGQFSAQAGAPSEFATADGINFNPGDSKIITFPTAG